MKIYSKGQVLLYHDDLEWVDQSIEAAIRGGVDLNEADLREADLGGALLFDGRLLGADFRLANLEDADLRNADVRGADFRGAWMRGALLSHAKLDGARFDGTGLRWRDVACALRGSDPFHGRGDDFGDHFVETWHRGLLVSLQECATTLAGALRRVDNTTAIWTLAEVEPHRQLRADPCLAPWVMMMLEHEDEYVRSAGLVWSTRVPAEAWGGGTAGGM